MRTSSATNLGRVRGLGSAHHGAGHWWAQRVSAAGNLLLVPWLIISLILLPDLGYTTVVVWLRQPIAAVPMLLLIGSVCWHFRLGAQVMIEDYVHAEGLKLMSLLGLNLYTAIIAFTAVFAVLKIAFGG
jgi:succinate dehydrogenase / fumarate reductase, membrane anchor subunit